MSKNETKGKTWRYVNRIFTHCLIGGFLYVRHFSVGKEVSKNIQNAIALLDLLITGRDIDREIKQSDFNCDVGDGALQIFRSLELSDYAAREMNLIRTNLLDALKLIKTVKTMGELATVRLQIIPMERSFWWWYYFNFSQKT